MFRNLDLTQTTASTKTKLLLPICFVGFYAEHQGHTSMNRIFWRIWYAWAEHVRKVSDYSWFTPKIAVTFVSFIFLLNWLLIFAVIGKQRYLATRALFIDSQGRTQPYQLLVWFIVTVGLLAWLFGSSRGRKLRGPWRSALLVMALAGFLGLVTELLLRF
jgi:hypothetical protein